MGSGNVGGLRWSVRRYVCVCVRERERERHSWLTKTTNDARVCQECAAAAEAAAKAKAQVIFQRREREQAMKEAQKEKEESERKRRKEREEAEAQRAKERKEREEAEAKRAKEEKEESERKRRKEAEEAEARRVKEELRARDEKARVERLRKEKEREERKKRERELQEADRRKRDREREERRWSESPERKRTREQAQDDIRKTIDALPMMSAERSEAMRANLTSTQSPVTHPAAAAAAASLPNGGARPAAVAASTSQAKPTPTPAPRPPVSSQPPPQPGSSSQPSPAEPRRAGGASWDPHRTLCPFELRGRCNDSTCTFAHLATASTTSNAPSPAAVRQDAPPLYTLSVPDAAAATAPASVGERGTGTSSAASSAAAAKRRRKLTVRATRFRPKLHPIGEPHGEPLKGIRFKARTFTVVPEGLQQHTRNDLFGQLARIVSTKLLPPQKTLVAVWVLCCPWVEVRDRPGERHGLPTD